MRDDISCVKESVMRRRLAEEYWWAMTQMVGRSCCDRSGSIGRWSLDFNWTALCINTRM